MHIARRLPAVPEALDPFRDLRVVRYGRPGVAERAEILRGIEAEGAADAECADRRTGARGEMRLTAVFNERQIVASGQRRECCHVGRLAIQVHRHERSRPRRDGCGARARIHRQRPVIDVHDDRCGSGGDDRQRRVGSGDRRHDDFVARADPGRTQQQRDSVCPRSSADGESRAAGGGELGLERFELRAEDVPPARCHARECIPHDAGVLARPQIEEWDPGSSSHRAGAGAEPGTYRSKCAR